MLYKFKSKASGDVIMTQPVGDAVLRAIGREPAAQGIVESAALESAISALEAAIAADEGSRDGAADDATKGASGDRVGLRQRAWPMIDMMQRARAAGEDIVWGV